MKKEKNYNIISTNKCNMKCKYCYSGESKNTLTMTLETAEKLCEHICNDIKKNNIEKVQVIFEGNEPLLNFEVFEYVCIKLSKELTEVEVDLSIFTNLVAMNDYHLNFFKKNKISVHTSLDGDEIIHDTNRGKGTYELVSTNIKKLVENKIKVNVSATVSRFSLKKPKEIVDTYLSLGLNYINLRYLHKLGDGNKQWNLLSYNPEEYLDFYKKVILYLIKLNFQGINIVEGNAMFFFHKIFSPEKVEMYSLPCNGVCKQLLYDPKGEIYTCDEGRNNPDLHKIGTIEKDIDNSKVNKFYDTNNSVASKYCAECEIKHICGPCIALNSPTEIIYEERCYIIKNLYYYFSELFKNQALYQYYKRKAQE
ncbi:MAG: radical SAM protein [Nanoarchaeota archaeon]